MYVICNKSLKVEEASRTSDHMTLINISSAAASLDPDLTCFIFTDLLCFVSRNIKKKKTTGGKKRKRENDDSVKPPDNLRLLSHRWITAAQLFLSL